MDHEVLDHRLENLPASIWKKITQIEELKGRWLGGVRLGPQVLGRLKQSVLITSTGATNTPKLTSICAGGRVFRL